VEVKLHTFLTSALDKGEWSLSLSGRSTSSVPAVRKKRKNCNATDATLITTPEDDFNSGNMFGN
jgi:hypothetical protein